MGDLTDLALARQLPSYRELRFVTLNRDNRLQVCLCDARVGQRERLARVLVKVVRLFIKLLRSLIGRANNIGFKQIVNLLPQVEVGVGNGKTLPRRCKEAKIME